MTVLSAKSTRSVLLIAPLLLFIALFFLWPLGVMMKQAISDMAVLRVLPQTAEAVGGWAVSPARRRR